MRLFAQTLCLISLAHLSVAGYTLEDDYNPSNFFSMFNFEEAYNPVNGFVRYINKERAQHSGLISSTKNSVYLGVDHTNLAPHGRKSVKLVSKKVYNEGLFILDLAHMPAGCGTWPAYWLLGPRWPTNGEIDIIEGVYNQAANSMTLHTGPGCSITNNNQFTGTVVTRNCNIHAPNQSPNAGCSIDAAKHSTYGAGLNSAGGGVYAAEWTSQAISIFFFPRGSTPADITRDVPNPQSWGKPLAMFQGHCNIKERFHSQRIIFNTAFCGNFSDAWSNSPCASKASSCHSFVKNNPSAFVDVFWKISSLKVYQNSG